MADPYSPEFLANPYPTLAELRQDEPVRRVKVFGFAEAYLVTRYDDARAVLGDPRCVKSLPGAPDPFGSLVAEDESVVTLSTDDPAEHARLRRRLMQGFSPRRLAGLRKRAADALDGLFDELAGRDGAVDLLAEVAYPFVFAVIGDIFGVPDEDREEFRQAMVGRRGDVAGDQLRDRNRASVRRTRDYLADLVRRKRATPGEDIVSGLLVAGPGDGALTDAEVFAALLQLVTASYVTSVNTIATGMWLLLSNPGQLAALPGRPESVRWAVEECLRFESPVLTADRVAARDLTLAGVEVPAGERLLVSISSANRDERRFERPDEFDAGRNPNPHLTFGHGARHCLGAAVARLEASLAFEGMARRFPGARLADPVPRWRSDGIVRGLISVPVLLSGGVQR
jgi:cytochrome P450